ncbi:hypothetical protein HXX76_015481 [Chlamydomonas incerta]|uniref:GOLD domain-containing protein n=1 Tax=Chlamydomonas incerta TaxID=51695 RepID=A0A835VRV6_CHLIN|nr:hypothetical protein HXX76_015481 [Chlamydomonas incerta]|eukprot:KAG2423224.1 hypothetical protein HXX76_015481 [Chlamydomonas incerta]
MGETVEAEHFSIPGGPRIDGRVLVSGNSQYYVPFVTIRVLSPTGDQIWQQQHVYQETHFNVGARGPGSYKVCFYNPWESRTDANVDLVYFTLAHLRRSASGGIQIPKGTQEDRAKEVASSDHMDDVKRTILGMSEFMQVISGSQKYLQRKLERHQKTMESNRDRTLFYTGLEVGLLLLVGLVQVLAVTGFFKPGKMSKVSV